MTSAVKPLRGPHRRRALYQGRIADAVHGRQKVWAVYGWITAEVRLLDAVALAELVARLTRIARDLNVRNGGPDDDSQ